MIVNWLELKRARANWHGDPQLFREAVSALDAALSQQEIDIHLSPPMFEISIVSQPPVLRALAAQQTKMLGYLLSELPVSAEDTIVP